MVVPLKKHICELIEGLNKPRWKSLIPIPRLSCKAYEKYSTDDTVGIFLIIASFEYFQRSRNFEVL
jgi:hypothetical protein